MPARLLRLPCRARVEVDRGEGIGWYLWELMIGADQTRYQWPGAEPVSDDAVFQGILYPDGTPYSSHEIELIRREARPAAV